MFSSSSSGSGTQQATGQVLDGLYSYSTVLLQLLTQRSAPGLLGTVQAALMACAAAASLQAHVHVRVCTGWPSLPCDTLEVRLHVA